MIEQTTLLALAPLPSYTDAEVLKKIKVIVTAYSSSIWETQGNPYITASGTYVRDGIVANNLLPFGTKIRLPEIFGDKIFVVEDRMNQRKGYYHVDVWFPSRDQALAFGSKLTEMEILTN
ncbi:3D domain-containing protein [bacterium]|nr:3D domain-containing protein [bacterium]